jgi:UDP-3-O-[3-hydroxymyristoyl] glucosamine N-acyltransferase
MQRALEHLALPIPRPAAGIHATAIVAKTATLGPHVALGPNVVVGERASVGAGCILHAGVVIGEDVVLGDGCELFANVVIRERCTIGRRVILHAGAVIGTDGFGYRWDGTRHAKQPHIGTVVIEDDVEIGSCSCVDRAKVDETRVGAGSRIDNLVQVGHNVRIGRHCIICAGTSIGGTTLLEDGVVIAGAAGIADHSVFRAGSRAGGMAGVHGEIPAGPTVVGVPAVAHANWLREQTDLHRLPELLKTVRALGARVAELDARSSK